MHYMTQPEYRNRVHRLFDEGKKDYQVDENN